MRLAASLRAGNAGGLQVVDRLDDQPGAQGVGSCRRRRGRPRGRRTGYVLPDDLDPVAEPERWAAFLPSLDPAVMGWAMPGRDWYLDGPAKQQLYDRSGNIGPTVWWDGRVVGGWAQRADGTIAHRLFEDIGTDGTQMVADTAGKLEAWLGDIRVKPRFPTPIDKELSA